MLPFNHQSIDDLLLQLMYTRKSTLLLLRSLSEADLSKAGTANGKSVTVNAIFWIIAGHCAASPQCAYYSLPYQFRFNCSGLTGDFPRSHRLDKLIPKSRTALLCKIGLIKHIGRCLK
jgi:hypothetical protein